MLCRYSRISRLISLPSPWSISRWHSGHSMTKFVGIPMPPRALDTKWHACRTPPFPQWRQMPPSLSQHSRHTAGLMPVNLVCRLILPCPFSPRVPVCALPSGDLLFSSLPNLCGYKPSTRICAKIRRGFLQISCSFSTSYPALLRLPFTQPTNHRTLRFGFNTLLLAVLHDQIDKPTHL